MRYVFWLLLIGLGVVEALPQASAHEVRSAYLELTEREPGQYQTTWKTPVRNTRPLAVVPVFPEDCIREPARSSSDAGYLISTFILSCRSPLEGRTIGFQGLEVTITDVLVRLDSRDGAGQTQRAIPDRPLAVFQSEASSLRTARTYFVLGVEHILLGMDHLLFVLALVLLIPGIRKLVETSTAFTLAHSFTLIGASLGWFVLPSAPVEAVIALSIVFLANEVANKQAGQPQLSERRPWLVASAFGLLHGFGFAGALTEIGLPRSDIPLALAAFNIGVEAGQLAFVAVLLLALRAVVALHMRRPMELILSYGVGIMASAWLFERLV